MEWVKFRQKKWGSLRRVITQKPMSDWLRWEGYKQNGLQSITFLLRDVVESITIYKKACSFTIVAGCIIPQGYFRNNEKFLQNLHRNIFNYISHHTVFNKDYVFYSIRRAIDEADNSV